jgi:hypothetical protein
MHRPFFRLAPLLASATLAALPLAAHADILQPSSFASLGTLDPAAGNYTASTSGTPTLTIGATTYTGVVVSQGPNLPDLAVFDFDNILIPDGVTITSSGPRVLALLSRGGITFSGNSAIQAGPTSGSSLNPIGAGSNLPSGGGTGGSGGGFGGAGGAGTGPILTAPGGATYGDLELAAEGGSPGGNASNNPDNRGGFPGGALELSASGTVTLAPGTVLAAGGASALLATHGGGGGGSGGAVILHAANLAGSSASLLSATGGNGTLGSANGNTLQGGGGGGGRVLIDLDTYIAGSTVLPSIDLSPGIGNPQAPATNGNPGHQRLVVADAIIPAGQVFTFAPNGISDFTTTDMEISGAAVRQGDYFNPGHIKMGDSATFSASGSISGGAWTLFGSSVTAFGGFSFDNSTSLSGFGTVTAPISSSSSASIAATGGALVIGNANSSSGVNFSGTISIGDTHTPASLILLDANHALIANTTIFNGSLAAPNGVTLAPGATLSSTNNASITGAFTNSGTVSGPTASATFLTFADNVNGAGNYTGNIQFANGFSPGNSPAAVSLQSFALTPNSHLTMELAGTTPGSQYDQLNFSGTAALDGTLDITLLDNFTPSLGDSFLLLNGGDLSGDFAAINLPTLAPGEQWSLTQSPTTLTATVTPTPEPATALLLTPLLLLLLNRRAPRPRNAP